MLTRSFLSIWIGLLATFSLFAHAAPLLTPHIFDAPSANKILSKAMLYNASDKVTISQVKDAIIDLSKLEGVAKKCEQVNASELGSVDKQLSEMASAQGKSPAITEEKKYLNQKRGDLTNQLSECRLFIMRADELNITLTKKLRLLLKNELLYPDSTAISNIATLPAVLQTVIQDFNKDLFTKQIGMTALSPWHTVGLILLLIFGLLSGNKLKQRLTPEIGVQTETQLPSQFVQTLCAVAKKYVTPSIVMVLFALFFTISSPSLKDPSYFAWTSYGILGYIAFLFLADFFFQPPKPAQGFGQLSEPLAKMVTRRLKLLGLLCLVAYCTAIVFTPQELPESISAFAKTIFITLLTINLISIIWIVRRLPAIQYYHKVLRFFISTALSLGLASLLVAEWLGYHLLVTYFLRGIMLTMLLIFLARVVLKVANALINNFLSEERNWQQKLHQFLGLKAGDRPIEIVGLRVLIYLVVWCGIILLLLRIWGLAETNFALLLNALLQGFDIGDLRIVPSRIVLGTLFFIFLALSTRTLSNYTAKRTNLHLAQGNRESLAAIVGYLGFAIALLLGLLVAGVYFSGLAIIAGALSVGIGFGLQNIVNNFVSGIILLIERPIKPGDRIIVGNTEGYVRRISIRSTHITTLERADVIMPNSDLISKPVTNYMLYDTHYKVSVLVNIAYGSNIELARELMLTIVKQNPQVINDRKGFEPTVNFKRFNNDILELELVCLIKDVELKGGVESDLNFAIEKAFRENDIKVAFPQREVTIKNWPPPKSSFPPAPKS